MPSEVKSGEDLVCFKSHLEREMGVGKETFLLLGSNRRYINYSPSHCYDRILSKSSLRNEGIILAQCLRGRHGSKDLERPSTCPQSESRQMNAGTQLTFALPVSVRQQLTNV